FRLAHSRRHSQRRRDPRRRQSSPAQCTCQGLPGRRLSTNIPAPPWERGLIAPWRHHTKHSIQEPLLSRSCVFLSAFETSAPEGTNLCHAMNGIARTLDIDGWSDEERMNFHPPHSRQGKVSRTTS